MSTPHWQLACWLHTGAFQGHSFNVTTINSQGVSVFCYWWQSPQRSYTYGTDLAAVPKFLSFLPRKPQPSPAALVRSQVNIVVKQGIKEAQVYTLESVEPQCWFLALPCFLERQYNTVEGTWTSESDLKLNFSPNADYLVTWGKAFNLSASPSSLAR